IAFEKLRVVVRHLFEMRHHPALVDGITVKASRQLVVYAAACHLFEGRGEDLAELLVTRAGVLINQQIESRRMGELRSAAESAVLLIEHLPSGTDDFLNHPGRKRAAFSREGLRVCYRSLDQLCLLGHVAILLTVSLGDRQQHAAKARAAVVLIGRKVSPAVERLSVWSEERGERP